MKLFRSIKYNDSSNKERELDLYMVDGKFLISSPTHTIYLSPEGAVKLATELSLWAMKQLPKPNNQHNEEG